MVPVVIYVLSAINSLLFWFLFLDGVEFPVQFTLCGLFACLSLAILMWSCINLSESLGSWCAMLTTGTLIYGFLALDPQPIGSPLFIIKAGLVINLIYIEPLLVFGAYALWKNRQSSKLSDNLRRLTAKNPAH